MTSRCDDETARQVQLARVVVRVQVLVDVVCVMLALIARVDVVRAVDSFRSHFL